ncbi:MAG: tyrosine-type recombinase/integrase [Geminicoccaceae bacterium]|jgi:integrase
MAAARDQAGNRTATEVARIMEREVLPYIGDGDLASIRKRDIIEIIDRVADRGATVRANRVLAWMRRFLNWCAARDLIDANPAQFVEKPSRETRRERVLDDGEIDLIWRALDASPQPFRDGLRLLILTAAMRDEIFGARWSELDEAGRCLKLPAERSKSGTARIIPLSPPALAIVEALPRFGANADRWLLTRCGKKPFSNFGHNKTALDGAAPLPDWRLHDLRRTAATGMQRLGFRLEVIEAALGHVGGSRAGIVGVYQRHAFHDETREALDRIPKR